MAFSRCEFARSCSLFRNTFESDHADPFSMAALRESMASA